MQKGTYTFPSLAPSVYSISASHAGFAAFYEAGLEVRGGRFCNSERQPESRQ